MEVAVTTDVGAGQRFNDDAACHEQLHRNVTLLAVADGFGRPQGIPSASIALEAVRDVIRRELRRATFPPRSLTANDVRQLLSAAFEHGNDRLLALGGGTDDYVAAGSTCTLVLIVSNQAFVAHVGDSRAYLLRHGELVQLTSDESLVPELVRSGSAKPATRNRQMPTLLTRALGVEPSAAVPPKIAHYTLHAHDAVLLCTDGVSRAISFADLQSAASLREGARGAAERIMALARGAGGVDNATVLLARNATVHGAPAEAETSASSSPWRWAAMLAAALALFVATSVMAREFWVGDAHLYLAVDGAGRVGLFSGSPESVAGIPLHVERNSFGVSVGSISTADRQRLAVGIPVTTPDAADAVVARWQAQARR